jgi:hypothetical protein
MFNKNLADSYYLMALHDILSGADIESIKSALEDLEVDEQYEACDGIHRAIKFSTDRTITEIIKEYDDTLDRIAEEIED